MKEQLLHGVMTTVQAKRELLDIQRHALNSVESLAARFDPDMDPALIHRHVDILINEDWQTLTEDLKNLYLLANAMQADEAFAHFKRDRQELYFKLAKKLNR